MELEIGNLSASQLVNEFGSPLYVYDEAMIERMIDLFVENFVSNKFATRILYASKAFQAIALLNLMADKGLSLDVVSQGELFAALKSRMNPENIFFHGNNKGFEELDFAISHKVGHIVVDNYMELANIAKIAEVYHREVKVSLRLNVGIEAHTHKYIITSHIDSKFGLSYDSVEMAQCLDLIEGNKFLLLEGFHSHIGSQIFDTTAWFAAIDKLIDYLSDFEQPLVLNIGGGFGIAYTQNDKPQALEVTLKQLVTYVEEKLEEKNLKIKELVIEPGRSLVAKAGTTLYTVGYQKETPNRRYYFVDGGMGDNIRPSLYQAKYSAAIANKLDAPKMHKVTVAGKYCESGDVLIEEIELPAVDEGDILAVYDTGAYGYSMSSNYNRNPIPAVVFVKDGQAREIIKRQTFEQLIENEVY